MFVSLLLSRYLILHPIIFIIIILTIIIIDFLIVNVQFQIILFQYFYEITQAICLFLYCLYNYVLALYC